MSFVVVIPARYASTRLPGKPLLDIAGKPMLQHVYERAMQSSANRVYIATDDERIAQTCRKFTDNICMTRASHQSGTDRIQEVVTQLQLGEQEIVVNVQGDEPLIMPEAIDQVAASLQKHPQAGISSLYEDIEQKEEYLNPNVVKVVLDQQGFALYFSRAPVPWCSAEAMQSLPTWWSGTEPPRRHIGIYAYRVKTLHSFVKWQQAPLEISERLEQLRAMVNGVRIHLTKAPGKMPPGVDTPEDLAAVRALLAGDTQTHNKPTSSR